MTSNERVIKVLLADDENLIRSALAAMLSLEDDLKIIAEAADGTEALAKARALSPDIAVLDLQMPGLDGVELAELLTREVPDCRTIIVTSHARPGYLKRALAVGARGFLPKTATGATLADVIRRVADGGRYVDPDLAADAISAGDSPLTPREADVLDAAADGAPIEEVARRVSLAAGTTRNYLSSAVTKLGARNRFDACTIARQRGWI
ncbi:response regulator transcription factor [Lolliginicoccus levis]|uniref:response regulator transcription factor n=1 Tax=Lolliginicoccus levis TaxID=2919542 RepID=UPI00241FE4CA|nr:response regulator transcription factor [Lolliginicoccus levis]